MAKCLNAWLRESEGIKSVERAEPVMGSARALKEAQFMNTTAIAAQSDSLETSPKTGMAFSTRCFAS